MNMIGVALVAVAQVFVICGAGAFMARKGILNASGRQTISQLVFSLLLPCLLFTKITASFDPAEFAQLIILPASAVVYIIFGIVFGLISRKLANPPEDFRRGQVAAAAFGNSGYLPMTLIVAVCASAPWLADDPGAGARGLGYVSVYLVGYSVLFWGTAFPYLGGGRPKLKQVLTPPIVTTLSAIVIALIPQTRSIVLESTWFQPIFNGADILGAAAIPGAMLLLGANLMDAPKSEGSLRITTTTVVARLVCMPAAGIFWVWLLGRWDLLGDDPVLKLVLLLESATPSAMNLIVMCQVHGKGEAEMSRLVARMYAIGIITITIAIAIHLKLTFGS